MSRSIVLSQTERHPLPPGYLKQDDPRNILVVFGLHNERGENTIYSTRVTDKLYDVLSKYDLVFYTGDLSFRERVNSYKQQVPPDVNIEMVGVAYRIRKLWEPTKYREFILELAEALEIESSNGKGSKSLEEMNIPVAPKPETPMEPQPITAGEDSGVVAPQPGVNTNEDPKPTEQPPAA